MNFFLNHTQLLEMESPQHEATQQIRTSTSNRRKRRKRKVNTDRRKRHTIPLHWSHILRRPLVEDLYKFAVTLLLVHLLLSTHCPANGQFMRRSIGGPTTTTTNFAGRNSSTPPPNHRKCLPPNCTEGDGIAAFINVFINVSDNSSTVTGRGDYVDKAAILNSIIRNNLIVRNELIRKPRRNVNEMAGHAAAIRHVPNNITINFINIQSINNKSRAKNTLPTKYAHNINHIFNKNDHDDRQTMAQKIATESDYNFHNNHNNNYYDDDADDNDADDNDADDENADVNIPFNGDDNKKLIKLVMDGLGLQRLPDMQKVNISQEEYTRKYKEYLKRLHEREKRNVAQFETFKTVDADNAALGILSIVSNATEVVDGKDRRKRESRRSKHPPNNYNEKTKIFLHFPFNGDDFQMQPGDIEEANIRLMLIHSPALALKAKKQNGKYHDECNSNRNKSRPSKQTATKPLQRHMLNLKVYQLLKDSKRSWLDGRKIEILVDRNRMDETHSQWLQFDVTKAVETWISYRHPNLGLEVQCDNCMRIGARILNDISLASKGRTQKNDNDENGDADEGVSDDDDGYQLLPVLNIIGRGVAQRELRTGVPDVPNSDTGNVAYHHNRQSSHDKRYKTSSNCYKENQRCCRHTMEVVFKEIKGFEFIIQPKVFDAGYCHGRCPPRYNPAHHHAMLQSLIWKQSRSRAPRPCCAPSKLVELEVLHVDEKDSEKLKISTWTDMRVIECACS